MKVYIGSDHAGFKFKSNFKDWLARQEISFEDLGPDEFKDGDDYPDYAFKVAEKVVSDKGSLGILLCGSGAGMAIAANKVKGARAVLAADVSTAIASRSDDDTNILCLRSRRTSFRKASKITSAWFKARFKNHSPYTRRVSKIEQYEN